MRDQDRGWLKRNVDSGRGVRVHVVVAYLVSKAPKVPFYPPIEFILLASLSSSLRTMYVSAILAVLLAHWVQVVAGIAVCYVSLLFLFCINTKPRIQWWT
jgi:hypothetical protein